MIETSFRGNTRKTTSKQLRGFSESNFVFRSSIPYFTIRTKMFVTYPVVLILISFSLSFQRRILYSVAFKSKYESLASFFFGREVPSVLFFSVAKWRGKERIVDISFKVKLWSNGQKLRQK